MAHHLLLIAIYSIKITSHVRLFVRAQRKRADYGKQQLIDLSRKLTDRFGRGWGAENLRLMCKLFLMYLGEIQNAFLEIEDGHSENQKRFLIFTIMAILFV